MINLPSFYMDMDGARQGNPNYKSTTRDVHKILERFKQKGVDAWSWTSATMAVAR